MNRLPDKTVEANIADAQMRHERELKETETQVSIQAHRDKLLMAVLNEACKAAILINGGAAVAMGALLQAIVDRAGYAPVRDALLWGIGITAIGVALAALTFVLRYFSLAAPTTRPYFGNGYGIAAFWVGMGSLAAFVLGVLIPVITGLRL